MAQQQVSGKKQQGIHNSTSHQNIRDLSADNVSELQMQYSNFKDTLQNIASQIGNVEQEVEEHKYVEPTCPSAVLPSHWCEIYLSAICDAALYSRILAHLLRNGEKEYSCH